MNIGEIAKKCATGPKTEMGKLRCSMNAIKKGSQLNQLGDSKMTLILKKYGRQFENTKKKVEEMEAFKMIFDTFGTKGMNEIESMLDVIKILKTDLAGRAMEKISLGVPLDSEDLKTIKILKESIESSHRMKHGVKHVSLTADLKDIRQMMLDE